MRTSSNTTVYSDVCYLLHVNITTCFGHKLWPSSGRTMKTYQSDIHESVGDV